MASYCTISSVTSSFAGARSPFDPKGDPHPMDTFVFGSAIGTRVEGFGRAWDTAVLKSHGHRPAYTILTP